MRKDAEARRQYARDYYARRVAKDPAYKRRWVPKESREAFINRALYGARYRARLKGIPFALAASDIVIPETCPVLGIPLCHGGDCPPHNRISLDRIRPELGYVPGNVRAISHRANTLRLDATADELRRVLAYVEDVAS